MEFVKAFWNWLNANREIGAALILNTFFSIVVYRLYVNEIIITEISLHWIVERIIQLDAFEAFFLFGASYFIIYQVLPFVLTWIIAPFLSLPLILIINTIKWTNSRFKAKKRLNQLPYFIRLVLWNCFDFPLQYDWKSYHNVSNRTHIYISLIAQLIFIVHGYLKLHELHEEIPNIATLIPSILIGGAFSSSYVFTVTFSKPVKLFISHMRDSIIIDRT